jgi:hypothetical protein
VRGPRPMVGQGCTELARPGQRLFPSFLPPAARPWGFA